MFCLRDEEKYHSFKFSLFSHPELAGSAGCFVYVTEVLSPTEATQRPLGSGNPQTSYPHICELDIHHRLREQPCMGEGPGKEVEREGTEEHLC